MMGWNRGQGNYGDQPHRTMNTVTLLKLKATVAANEPKGANQVDITLAASRVAVIAADFPFL